MSGKYWWIMERHNPQLGIYYVARGRCTVREARKAERPGYGTNDMHKFTTQADYEARLAELRAQGEKVR